MGRDLGAEPINLKGNESQERSEEIRGKRLESEWEGLKAVGGSGGTSGFAGDDGRSKWVGSECRD